MIVPPDHNLNPSDSHASEGPTVDQLGHPRPEWTSEHGDWTQVRGGAIHYHPQHPEYYDSDDAQIEAYYQLYEQGEAEYIRDRDHATAEVLDQYSSEPPGADTSTLQMWDRYDRSTFYELTGDYTDGADITGL